MPPENKPVGSHAVDYLLECGHVNEEKIDAAIFLPKVGDVRVCKRTSCKQRTKIKQVFSPYWLDAEEEET